MYLAGTAGLVAVVILLAIGAYTVGVAMRTVKRVVLSTRSRWP
jgi:hypothetical protein